MSFGITAVHPGRKHLLHKTSRVVYAAPHLGCLHLAVSGNKKGVATCAVGKNNISSASGGDAGGKESKGSSPIDKLKELSKDAIQKKAAQDSQMEALQTQLTATLKDLEVAKQEAASAENFRKEVEARTAAMANLQAQLDQVESIRSQELASSVNRFEELESALTLAETSMGAQAKKVSDLEERLVAMAKELEGAAQQADVLRAQIKGVEDNSKGGSSSPTELAKIAELEKQLASAQALESGLRTELTAASDLAKSLTAQIESLSSALEQKDAELKGARHLTEEVAKAAERSEAELRMVQEELKAARQLEIAAAARAQELEVLAAKEAAGAREMIETAEALASIVGQRLAELAELKESLYASATESEEEESENEDELAGYAARQRRADLGSLTEADVEAVLDELEYLRGELEAELQASEELAERVESSESEAIELRKQLAAMASAGDESSVTMGGFSQTLVQELAASRAESAAAAGELESLKVTNKALGEEVKRLREQAQAAPAAAAAAVAGRFGGGNKELAAALNKVAELERVNAELREAAIAREAALAEGRQFLRSYLERSVGAGTTTDGSSAAAGTKL